MGIIISTHILEMKKLRHREVKELSQGHTEMPIYLLFAFLIEVYWIYNVSGIQQSDSVLYTYIFSDSFSL